MFKKAFSYDDSTIFYFDQHDHKHVAKGGSLAWRLNNPGLVPSHSPLAKEFGAIGSCKQYAIFSHPLFGNDAHRAWLCQSKYCDNSLIEIAKYYQPKDPEAFLKKLCEQANLPRDSKPRSLSSSDFEQLLKSIQYLVGFSKKNEGEFCLLPKITARFCSRDKKVDFYLVGADQILSQQEAICWVETHLLDAVIVHKNNGTLYLRSRPGHHFTQLRFTDEQGVSKKEPEEIIREVGQEKPGQCIWAFVNGLATKPERALECATRISKYAGGERVWSLINDGVPNTLWKVPQAVGQKLGWSIDVVKNGIKFFKFLINLSDKSPLKPAIVVFAHSQGAMVVDLALKRLSPEERKRIRIFSFGGAAFISQENTHPDSHNYFSAADPIPKYTSQELCRFALRLHEAKKRGSSPSQMIEGYIKEDLARSYEGPFDLESLEQFQNLRKKHYEYEMLKAQNITVLESGSDSWEHSFDLPSYQEKIQEIIARYSAGGAHGS